VRNYKHGFYLKEPINLLLVCHQIPTETGLPPYILNTRGFEEWRYHKIRYNECAPSGFLEKLTAEQREVMRDVWVINEFGVRITGLLDFVKAWMRYARASRGLDPFSRVQRETGILVSLTSALSGI
jgi:hypothetical protein